MNKDLLEEKGRQLSWLLRHDIHSFAKGLIDEYGWRSVDEVMKNYHYSQELLDEIMATNNKKRYEYNDDKTRIRARQGHSITVNVELKEMVPLDILYHGTCTRFIDSILKEGLKSQSRLYVHLSPDLETATSVGLRHGKLVMLEIDSKKMYEKGYKFYLSNNGVWLTNEVPIEYIKVL